MGVKADVGSSVLNTQHPLPSSLELTIDTIVVNPSNSKEADVYFTRGGKPYPYVVDLNPEAFKGSIKKGNTLIASVDETQKILGIISIYEKNKRVYTVTEHT